MECEEPATTTEDGLPSGLHRAVNIMNDVAYLQSQRMTATERAEFIARYDLAKIKPDPYLSPEEMLESHSHHAEFNASRH